MNKIVSLPGYGFNKDSLGKATTKSVISLELGKYGLDFYLAKWGACATMAAGINIVAMVFGIILALFWSELSTCAAFKIMGENTSLKESKSIKCCFILLIVNKSPFCWATNQGFETN